MLEETNGEYANRSAPKAISGLETQNTTQAANDYAQAHLAAGSKEQPRQLQAVVEEEKLLKLSDA